MGNSHMAGEFPMAAGEFPIMDREFPILDGVFPMAGINYGSIGPGLYWSCAVGATRGAINKQHGARYWVQRQLSANASVHLQVRTIFKMKFSKV